MSDHTYDQIELTGTSAEGSVQAMRNAVARANTTIRGLHWFEVQALRGEVEDGRVARWQVSIKLGFTLEDSALA